MLRFIFSLKYFFLDLVFPGVRAIMLTSGLGLSLSFLIFAISLATIYSLIMHFLTSYGPNSPNKIFDPRILLYSWLLAQSLLLLVSYFLKA